MAKKVVKSYRVLKPIAYGGRVEKGEIVELPEADAENIGIGEYLEEVKIESRDEVKKDEEPGEYVEDEEGGEGEETPEEGEEGSGEEGEKGETEEGKDTDKNKNKNKKKK